ncbi:agmatinase [Roseivirga pacifica]|uniref:agmatinase n=1 Tax=Roseivirga pacifica TaxID=1267423 RepID=UPI003BAF9845
MPLIRTSISHLSKDQIALIGIPFDAHSSFLQGPAKAPELIIEAIESDSANYFTESLNDLNEHPRIAWCGNADFEDYFSISQPIEAILKKGAIPFSLGGDHSITYPILKAIHKHHGKVNILHFDAHTDLYDELDNNKYSHACPFARIMEEGLANSLTQVGIRTLTQHTKEQAERFGVNIIQMKDWTPETKFEIEGPVYLSFDIDVLDPAFAPGISHHEPGGFSTREILGIIQQLNLDIVGLDVVEYNPERDINGVTAMVAAKVVKELIDRLL